MGKERKQDAQEFGTVSPDSNKKNKAIQFLLQHAGTSSSKSGLKEVQQRLSNAGKKLDLRR